MLVSLEVRFFSKNVDLLQAPRFHVRPPGPHVTPPEVGTTGDERPLVTLEVVGPKGRGSRFHPIQVLKGPDWQLCDEVLRPDNVAAYNNAIGVGVELHKGHVQSCKRRLRK
ncbi:hypothetical protein TIFTF001_017290 [Ficus carica]|uniref:Uncharacterized protein n=1 Tax=Ficus carica TaxID=3494 RepID=A0AA88AQH4_FICCA|nr:hypothetical protein TIFTF001_017290 [Ficus carica]